MYEFKSSFNSRCFFTSVKWTLYRCKHICKPLQADPQTKVCKRASTSPTQEKLFLKISFPSKIFKLATAQPTNIDQNTHWTMTAKPLLSPEFYDTADRTPAGNSGFAKAGVQCFGWQFFRIIEVWFFKWTVVLKSPRLRKAAKRWQL